MASMPRGEPRTVPDEAGELYDQYLARQRAIRVAEDRGRPAPLEGAAKLLRDFQAGPDIPRPSTAQSFIPVVGPAWEAVADVQDGDYGGAAFNAAMAAGDLLPIGIGLKGVRAAVKGVGVLKKGSVTANAAAKSLRAKGMVKPGHEVHHTVPLRGTSRTAQDPRNHYALLKVLPKEQHRRLTGSWNGKPRYDPIRRVWYGTTDWQKSLPAGLAADAADAMENLFGRKRAE